MQTKRFSSMSATEKATTLGTEHGTTAAEWYCQDMSNDNYRGTLQGIEDGDPMTLDGFPEPGLNGEWADSYSLNDLARDTNSKPENEDFFMDICTAYEDAFHMAVQNEIERVCRYHLS